MVLGSVRPLSPAPSKIKLYNRLTLRCSRRGVNFSITADPLIYPSIMLYRHVLGTKKDNIHAVYI
jgi:hypothetical protein